MSNLTVIIQRENLARIDGRWTVADRMIVNSVPDRFRWGQTGAFLFDPTPGNIEYLKANLNAEWIDKIALAVEPPKNPVNPQPVTPFEPKTAMMAHQVKAFEWARILDVFALFLDKGLGKTKILLDTIADRFERNQLDGALVIAPNGVHRQWIDQQIPIHMVERFQLIAKAHTSSKPVLPKDKVMRSSDTCRILSINVDAFSRGAGYDLAKQFLQSGNMAIIVDESTRIRNPGAKRTDRILNLAHYAKVRIIASGNPAPHGIENLYSQFRFLDRSILGHGSYASFQRHYCVLEQVWGATKGVMQITGYRNVDELNKRIKPFSISARKEECVDLPPKLYEQVYVEPTEEQRDAYNRLRLLFIMEIENKTITVPNALVRVLRLQQILSGFAVDEDGTKHNYANNRLQVLQEQLEDIDGKVIVWARFREDIDQICAMLKKEKRSFVRYDGSTPTKDREKAVTEFMSGGADVFVSNPAAGGIGLNLQVASNVIYYNNSYDYEHREQSEDRAHRIGTTSPVTYIDLIVPHSVDTVIMNVLRERGDLATLLMETGPTLLRELE